ncbi:unnamed protein product [Musa hybrid cultivar]
MARSKQKKASSNLVSTSVITTAGGSVYENKQKQIPGKGDGGEGREEDVRRAMQLQEQFDKSATGRAARAQIAATKKSIEPSKGEPVLKGVVVAVADGMITLFLWIINSKVINYCFSFP